MATGYTPAQLDALRAALASGELRVSYDGNTVEYRSIDDLARAIRIVEAGMNADAAAVAGIAPPRLVRIFTSKGT